MTPILDTGPIVAALNEQDPDHQRCATLLARAQDLLVPSPVLVEVDYWLVKLAGPKVWSDFVADINRGAYRVVHPTDSDLICRIVCQVGVFDRVRWAGGLGWSGERGAGLGVGVASLMMRGLGTPGPGFVLPACAV